MKLEFKVKEFISTRESRSFTDMMTRQESGTFNVWYRIENQGRFQKFSNMVLETIDEANKFIDVLNTKSVLYVGNKCFKNGEFAYSL